jgi:hypothetical protein
MATPVAVAVDPPVVEAEEPAPDNCLPAVSELELDAELLRRLPRGV